MKKKIIATILTGIMAMSMTACGSTASSDTASAAASSGKVTSSSTKETEGKTYSMTYIMLRRDEFNSSLESAAKEAAAEMGINLSTQDANSDSSKQIQYIESAANAKEDAVLVGLVDVATGKECIEAAGGMPIVFINNPLEDDTLLEEYDNAVFVGSNESEAGQFQGEYLAEYFKEQGKTDVNYIMLEGLSGYTSTIRRTDAAKQALADNGINAIPAAADLVADYDRATAMDMISPLIGTAEIDCIIANNDAMALGAIEALKAKNIDPSTIPVVGIDATADGIQAIEDGEMAMTVFQNPIGQGSAAVKVAVNLLEGKEVNEGTGYELDETNKSCLWVPFEPVTAENVADYK